MSVQHVQAVASPYGAGTSSVPPTHSSRPHISTLIIENIINSGTTGIPDVLPREDLIVYITNINNNYEDCIILSNGSKSRGLFNYLAYSAQALNENETVLDPGEKVIMERNRWWKTYGGEGLGMGHRIIDGRKDIQHKWRQKWSHTE